MWGNILSYHCSTITIRPNTGQLCVGMGWYDAYNGWYGPMVTRDIGPMVTRYIGGLSQLRCGKKSKKKPKNPKWPQMGYWH